MAGPEIEFEMSVFSKISQALGVTKSDWIHVQPSRGVSRPDALIRKVDGSDFVVQLKYYPDSNQDLHFGTLAETAASADAISDLVGKPVGGIVVTNAEVPPSLHEMAGDMGLKIFSVKQSSGSKELSKLMGDIAREPGGDVTFETMSVAKDPSAPTVETRSIKRRFKL